MSFLKREITRQGYLARPPPQKRLNSVSSITIEPKEKRPRYSPPTPLVDPFKKFYEDPLLKYYDKLEAEEQENAETKAQEEESKRKSLMQELKEKIKTPAEKIHNAWERVYNAVYDTITMPRDLYDAAKYHIDRWQENVDRQYAEIQKHPELWEDRQMEDRIAQHVAQKDSVIEDLEQVKDFVKNQYVKYITKAKRLFKPRPDYHDASDMFANAEDEYHKAEAAAEATKNLQALYLSKTQQKKYAEQRDALKQIQSVFRTTQAEKKFAAEKERIQREKEEVARKQQEDRKRIQLLKEQERVRQLGQQHVANMEMGRIMRQLKEDIKDELQYGKIFALTNLERYIRNAKNLTDEQKDRVNKAGRNLYWRMHESYSTL